MLKLVALLGFVSVVYGAVERYPPQDKPVGFEDQQGCYIVQIGRVLPYDEDFYPNIACGKYRCQSSNNETLYETCGAKALPDPEKCQLTAVDNTKQYPNCCGDVLCVD